MSSNELMIWTVDDQRAVFRTYGRSAETVLDDVASVKRWLQQQRHIPEVSSDKIITTFLTLNKFSVERAKEKIDNYYAIRNFIPMFFARHPLDPVMLRTAKACCYVTMPQLVGLSRIVVFKYLDDPENFDPELLFCHMCNFIELRLLDDCMLSDVVVFDVLGIKMAHVTRLRPHLLAKFLAVVEKVYSTRVKGLHLIHDVFGFDSFLAAIKAVMKEKLRERIHVHRSYETLFEHLPKECLPEDFGGEGKSLRELIDLQIDGFRRHEARFDRLKGLKSREELREGKTIDEGCYGLQGNFKQLNVD